ncbi:MAG: hydrogenase subunit MbhD domain-containing protein [Oscillospiraceae bacterium]
MDYFKLLLLGFLIFCAVATAFSKRLLVAVIVFMAYSLIMTVVWLLLQAPDLAITETAVGVGITSLLFFVTLRKINLVKQEDEHDDTK